MSLKIIVLDSRLGWRNWPTFCNRCWTTNRRKAVSRGSHLEGQFLQTKESCQRPSVTGVRSVVQDKCAKSHFRSSGAGSGSSTLVGGARTAKDFRLIRGWVGVDENLRQGLTTQLITARQQQAALAANKHGIRSEESQVQAEANSIIRQTRWHRGIDRLREEKAKLELSWAKPRRLPTSGRVALQLADSRRSSAASQQADTAKRPFDGNLNLKTERDDSVNLPSVECQNHRILYKESSLSVQFGYTDGIGSVLSRSFGVTILSDGIENR
ncbi:proteasome subunit alpha type [Culex quinquefasciatus]|uniref:Proteasome subunit alpha type n=1 Tax=Culex quinquefasciatus TaxID=7176 RepID=B0X8I4_CULQU|nr:proteasome subunit alpha type [Culex quinquefasciatus]|eukprot:XP_001865965.1 proteasome subunit alpha type [Culex quinquefasciatus]